MRENMTALFMFIGLCCGFLQADTGRIKLLSDGDYGEIESDNDESVYYFDPSELEADGLSEGDDVSYDIDTSGDAVNIKLMQ